MELYKDVKVTKLQKLKTALKESLAFMNTDFHTKQAKAEQLNKHYIIIDSIINIVGFEQYLIIAKNIESN